MWVLSHCSFDVCVQNHFQALAIHVVVVWYLQGEWCEGETFVPVLDDVPHGIFCQVDAV